MALTNREKQARFRRRGSVARGGLPGVLAAFAFEGSLINEGLVRSLHDGAFLANHRNIVLVDGTGTGKTHLAIAITANVVRRRTRALLQHRRSGQPAGG